MSLLKVPVLVVGGGIGGLTAALALHRAGISNKLILRETSFSTGARNAVVVAGSAVRILDRLGLGPLLRTHGSPITQGEIETARGKPVVSVDVNKIGTEAWVVPRSSLQQFFVESLPPDTVHFGTKLRSLRANSDQIEVEMKHNPNGPEPLGIFSPRNFTSRLAANLVVGADGLSSTVRSSISRPMLTTSGKCIWQAVTKTRDNEAYPAHTFREIWTHLNTRGAARTRFGFTRITSDEVAWWAVSPSVSEVFLRPFVPKLLSLFDEYPEPVHRLIKSVENDRNVQRHQVRQIWPDSTSWIDHTSSRIALIGDAGRVGEMGNLHNGCTFAIEDAYMLAHFIAEQGGPEDSRLHLGLRAYEQNREAHDAMARDYTDKFYRLATTQSAVSRYFLRKYVLASLEHESTREIAHTTTP